MEDLIGYDAIIENAMRNVIHDVVKKVASDGLKGGHHFVLSFSTKHPGVVLPSSLQQKFPQEMTIIVQHQFRFLNIEKNNFTISLNFSGAPETITIPYGAITSFSDPSVHFGLKFNFSEIDNYEEDSPEEDESMEEKLDSSSVGQVISLDDFRKNRNKK